MFKIRISKSDNEFRMSLELVTLIISKNNQKMKTSISKSEFKMKPTLKMETSV